MTAASQHVAFRTGPNYAGRVDAYWFPNFVLELGI